MCISGSFIPSAVASVLSIIFQTIPPPYIFIVAPATFALSPKVSTELYKSIFVLLIVLLILKFEPVFNSTLELSLPSPLISDVVDAHRFELFRKYYEHLNDTPVALKICYLISSLKMVA